MDLEWETPPEEALLRSRGAGGKYIEVAIALRARSGEWARLPGDSIKTNSSAMGMAQNIRRGKVKGFDAGEFEAVAHETTVWVRHVGKKEGEEAPEEGSRKPASDLAPKVRQWAREHGYEVKDRGVLPREIIDLFFADPDVHEPRPPDLTVVK